MMKEKGQKDPLRQLYLLLFLSFGALLFLSTFAFGQVGPAANYRNFSVTTQLNITNSVPEILAITTVGNISLNAGANTSVACNVTVRDLDGIGEIILVNATLFDTSVKTLNDVSDYNDHYQNTSCTLFANNSNTGNFTCDFQVRYFANSASTWNCTAFAVEVVDNNSDNLSQQLTVNQLLALNVTGIIDYGNMAVGDISNSTSANVTNFGNVGINVTVRGYGVTEGDGLAMICDQNNISINEERYSTNQSLPWANMVALTGTSTMVGNLSIFQRTNDSVGGETRNNTYWTIRVPSSSNPSGQCNGTIIFQAEAAV